MRAIVLVLIGIIMSGCSSVDTRKVSGVYKSPKPYKIKGRWYEPQSHYGYNEKGIASWYGPGFHGKLMANGERYNMNSICAAHKTLPLPSVVEVTNLKNGARQILVVTDRGPFVDDRIIDLSKGAARKLGVLGHGIVNVQVKTLTDESRALSNYLARHGKRGHVRGRSWINIYKQEIAGNAQLYAAPPRQAKPKVIPTVYRVPKRGTKVRRIATHPVLRPPTDIIPHHARNSLNQLVETAHYTPESRPSHVIQAATFMKAESARKLAGQLSQLGRVNVKEISTSSGQNMYQVHLGPYTQKEEADEILSTIMSVGHDDAILIKE